MEDETAMPSDCAFLKNPLSLNELINGGTNFEINTNFAESFVSDGSDLCEELNFLGSDDEDCDTNKTNVDHTMLVSPWTKSFADLRLQMTKVNEHIYKRVTQSGKPSEGLVPENARVCIRYNAYWEHEGAPFDSSFLRGSTKSFYTGQGEVLEGLEMAVRTMYRGEHAQFVISYQLLFHEMGCPPRVKPRADGLFTVELLSFNAVGDVNADLQLSQQDKDKFHIVQDKVKQIHLKALDFFRQGHIRNACRAFEKAASVLNFCRLANEQEKEERDAYLLRLYINLIVCYNKLQLPKKTCIMCKEIRNLTHDKPPPKALFNEGRALLMLGEYERARTLLGIAQQKAPTCTEINKELKELDERYSRYKEDERRIWTRALGIVKKSESAGSGNTAAANEQMNEFEQEMAHLLDDFKQNKNLSKFTVPTGLTAGEIATIDKLVNQLRMKLILQPSGEGTYVVCK